MAIESNIPELIRRLEEMKAKIVSGEIDISSAMTAALNTGMGAMRQRIFNAGQDAEGVTLGKYVGEKTKVTGGKFSKQRFSVKGLSVQADVFKNKELNKQNKALKKRIKGDPDGKYTEYEKYRLSRGRQIEYKDLEMDGSLRKSIQTVATDNLTAVVAITNAETAIIARGQEAQIGKIRGSAQPAKIFIFSKEEFELTKEQGNRLIGQIISENLK